MVLLSEPAAASICGGFSFCWLFWKKDIELQSPGGQSIFRHELVHIQEHHSVDKMMMQLVLALCWVNPVFWLIRRELQLIYDPSKGWFTLGSRLAPSGS